MIERVIRTISEAFAHVLKVEFLKICSEEELRLVFYFIWNMALEAKQLKMIKEC